MSVTGLCGVCESAEATHRCERCGTLVCEKHYDAAAGVCTVCAAEMGPRPGDRGTGEDGSRPGDGDTYRQ